MYNVAPSQCEMTERIVFNLNCLCSLVLRVSFVLYSFFFLLILTFTFNHQRLKKHGTNYFILSLIQLVLRDCRYVERKKKMLL